MDTLRFSTRSWNGRRLKVASVTPEERKRIVRETIASRAFQLSEARGFEPGHGLDDWRRAEAEILGSLNCGCLVLDRSLELSTDAACFAEGTIEIYVEPRRLTICGKGRECAADPGSVQTGAKISSVSIVRNVDLPFEIDPSRVSATFKGRMIQIELPKACATLTACAAI
ncbi:MAG TPA: DUF2934 domain-containing protein [Candidatus Acidoferrales bacterium]|nr:DUF2934 domain-containing protein [Candidatus Acidoferrales bacterium]